MTATSTLPDAFVLHEFESVGSTNDEARRLAETGAADGQVVVAGEQTAGRGRYGRSWTSPPGNLYASVLLRPRRELRDLGQLSLVASLALAEAITGLARAPLDVTLKWPNDVLLRAAKVAGILLESGEGTGGQGLWVIIGSGVNVASAPEGTPYPVTSLALEGLDDVTPARLLRAYLGALDRWRSIWEGSGFGEVRTAWMARGVGLGGPIRLRLPSGEIAGRFVDLSASGTLLLEFPDGARREIAAGDIVLGSAA